MAEFVYSAEMHNWVLDNASIISVHMVNDMTTVIFDTEVNTLIAVEQLKNYEMNSYTYAGNVIVFGHDI